MDLLKELSCERACSAMPVKKEVVPAGTTIHQEQPFVYTLCSKFRTECCDFCLKKGSELSKCSNCKYVYYCDKFCQKKGWTVHKQECKFLKAICPRVLPDAARVIYRLMKMLENGGMTMKGYYGGKNYRMWRDLMSHYAELKNDNKRMEHMMSLYEVLKEFAKDESLPNEVEFMCLYGRMCVNSFSICNQELQSVGTGIYLGASILDHSCQPNALATFEGTTLIIRTLENLPYLDWSKIRISYIDVMATTKERQRELLERYYFLCDCPKCSSPENSEIIYGAACTNDACDNSVMINDNSAQCHKCGTVLSHKFIKHFKEVMEFTESHLNDMKNMAYLDVCKICLKQQKNVLNRHNLKHVKILDLAFDAAIDLGDFDSALEYGLELTESYKFYFPKVHPLTGLLHLKLCKLLLYKGNARKAIHHLKESTEILRITHGCSSLYKTEVTPLIQQCREMSNIGKTK